MNPNFLNLFKKTLTRSRSTGANHLRHRLLTDLRNYRLRLAIFAKVGEQQENTCQSPLGGIENLVGEIFFHANSASQYVRHEKIRKVDVLVKKPHYCLFRESKYRRASDGARARYPGRMSRHQAALAKELTGLGDGEHCFLSLLGHHRYLDPAFLDVKHTIRRIPLRENELPVTELLDQTLEFSQKGLR